MLRKLVVSHRLAAGVLQVVGLAAISAGVAMIDVAAGTIAAGVGALVLGVAVERGDG